LKKQKILKEKRRVARRRAKITLSSPRYAAKTVHEALARRVSIVEQMVNQLVSGQGPLLSEVYQARQGALSVMSDLNTIKATILGHSTGWERP
jgi:hypothetical protein